MEEHDSNAGAERSDHCESVKVKMFYCTSGKGMSAKK